MVFFRCVVETNDLYIDLGGELIGRSQKVAGLVRMLILTSSENRDQSGRGES